MKCCEFDLLVNNFECLSQTNLQSLILCFRVRLGAYPRGEFLKGTGDTYHNNFQHADTQHNCCYAEFSRISPFAECRYAERLTQVFSPVG
jgi:hypothetical protein